MKCYEIPQHCNESSAEWNSIKIFTTPFSQTYTTVWNLFTILPLRLHATITFRISRGRAATFEVWWTN